MTDFILELVSLVKESPLEALYGALILILWASVSYGMLMMVSILS